MQEHHAQLSSFRFQRAKTDGLIEVLNEGSYVMAEYSERTGIVKWQRVVLAAQKEKIEKWLDAHYPVQPAPTSGRSDESPLRKRVPAAKAAAAQQTSQR